MGFTRIEIEIEGIDELKSLIREAEEQSASLLRTVEKIDTARIALQAKLNQPPEASDGR